MTDPTELAVDALAVARLTRLAQDDEVWPLLELRSAFDEWAGDSRLRDLSSCKWCGSMWLGIAVAFLRWRFPRAWPYAAKVLAASAVTGYIEQATDR